MRKNKLIVLFIMVFILVVSISAYSVMTTDYYNYWYSDSESAPVVAWEPSISSDVVKYNVVALWIVGTEVRQTYNIGDVTSNEVSIPAPRIGSFIIGVKAVDSKGLSSPYIYSSVGANSIVNGQPKPWMITYYMGKPGPIIIGKFKTKIIGDKING